MQAIASSWLKIHKEGGTMKQAMRLAGLKGATRSNFFRYRRMTEEGLGITLPPLGNYPTKSWVHRWPTRTHKVHMDGLYQVVISTDHHYYPGVVYPAHVLLCKVLKDIKPEFHINNGDAFNGGKVGRFGSIGWEPELPSTVEEFEAAKLFTDELVAACDSENYWMIGNHDLRLENYLANNVPKWEGMPGSTLEELFPDWIWGWSIAFNDTLIIKHRFHQGVHAARNNTLNAGTTFLSGHCHRLNIMPITDYRGTRYGIECGTIADPYSPSFHYTEDNPVNWQEGFVILTVSGKDIHPELVYVNRSEQGAHCLLRGKRYEC